MTSGPWMDDADLVWRTVNTADSDNYGATQAQMITGNSPEGSYDWGAALANAWGGSPTELSVFSGADLGQGLYGELSVQDATAADGTMMGSADWYQVWVTVTATETTVESSTLPTSVYANGAFVDPTVTGVEWEPTSTPLGSSIQVAMASDNSGAPSVTQGAMFIVHTAKTTAPYAPGHMTAEQIAGLPSPGQLTGGSDPLTFDPGAFPTGSMLGLTVLDSYTETRTTPERLATNSRTVTYPFKAVLQQSFRPRYRLLYAGGGDLPPLRQVQRGDGLGMSSAPRAIQHTSQQATLRNVSYL